MFFWLAFGAIFAVWNVFQSSGLDYRLVALGSLLPVILDAPWGGQMYAHTLLVAVAVFVLAMALTSGRGKRLRRRRALSLSIGWFAGLVLGAAWANKEVFWWPFFGVDLPDVAMFPPLPVLLVEELLGLAAACWTWTRCELADPERRREFWRTGRLTIREQAA